MHNVGMYIMKIGVTIILPMMNDKWFEYDCNEFDVDWNITLLLFITFDVAWWFTLDIIRWMKGEQKHDE